jgi:hypothetical protein
MPSDSVCDASISHPRVAPIRSNRSENFPGHNFLSGGGFLAEDITNADLIPPQADPFVSLSDATTIPASASPTSSTGVLYLQQPGGLTTIDVKDVNQGQIGDCFLLASICELAFFAPNAIMNMIHANADGTETVTLYTNGDGSLVNISTYQAPSSTAAFRPVSVTVNNAFPSSAVNNYYSPVNGQTEIWVQVLEEAVATLYSAGGPDTAGYALLNNGGFSLGAMEVLTGLPGSNAAIATVTAAQLTGDLAAGDLITIATTSAMSTTLDLIESHEYAFEGITTVNGTPMVQLYNPWGEGPDNKTYWLPGTHEEVTASTPGALPIQPSLIPLASLLTYLNTASGGYTGTITISPPPMPGNGPGGAVLHGSHGQYIVADNNGSIYVQDAVSGRDGIQTLTSVTELRFTDGTGVFDPTGTAEDVARIYGAALGRAPDVGGLEYWTAQFDNSHLPLSAIATSFTTSAEFIHNYGSLADSDFVNQLYRNVLGRAADTAGTQAWDGALASGASRGAVVLGFAESQENDARTISAAGDLNHAEAYRLYQAALNREPDAGGLAYWSSTLAGGAMPAQVAQDFINSAEFQQKYGSLSASDFVSTLYQNALHRVADPGGQQYWTSQLQQGTSETSVLVAFSDSLENRVQTASATHANWVFIPS